MLAALLHDVGKPPTQTFEDRIRFSGHEEVGARLGREILTRLKYPNDVIDEVAALVRQHMMFKDAPQMGESRLPAGLSASLDLKPCSICTDWICWPRIALWIRTNSSGGVGRHPAGATAPRAAGHR